MWYVGNLVCIVLYINGIMAYLSLRRSLAVPVTHCNPYGSEYQKQCYGGSSRPDVIQCMIFPKDSQPYNLAFRNQVYFGQFRSIGELLVCHDPPLSITVAGNSPVS